jgi:hypothetical protein
LRDAKKERRELAEKRENWVGWRGGSIQKIRNHHEHPLSTTSNHNTNTDPKSKNTKI